MKEIILGLLGHLARGVGPELTDPVAVGLVLVDDGPEEGEDCCDWYFH